MAFCLFKKNGDKINSNVELEEKVGSLRNELGCLITLLNTLVQQGKDRE